MDNKPKTSKAQQKAVYKYTKNHYDRISVYFPSGYRERLQRLAEIYGESINAYINKAVQERMERDLKASDTTDPQ